MKVYFQALGCRLNEAELERWAGECQRAGVGIASCVEEAQLAVLNTCAVTAEAVRKSRQSLRRLHRANPAAKLVVTGCHATLSRAEVAAELGVDWVIDNADKDRLVPLLRGAGLLPTMPEIATVPGEASLFQRHRQRAFIKVQDGCRYRCSYCIVTAARGAERSRPIAELIDEIRRLHALGVQEAVLTGVHVGGYGSDLGCDLASLVAAILADTDLPRLRFASVEPWDLPAHFWALFDNPRLMPHMHLPLQSGADSVLRRMARRCKIGDFRALVEAARSRVADFNVSTDIIVGFPGESEAEWAQTLAAVDAIDFGQVHIFNFSPRAGTRAAQMPAPVDADTRAHRSRQLHARAAAARARVQHRFLGRCMAVLWEGRRQRTADGGVVVSGYTPNYLRVQMALPAGAEPLAAVSTARLEALIGGPRGTLIRAAARGDAA